MVLNSTVINNGFNQVIELFKTNQKYDLIYSINKYDSIMLCQDILSEFFHVIFLNKKILYKCFIAKIEII